MSIVCRNPHASDAEMICALLRDIVSSSFPQYSAEARNAYFEPWTQEAVRKRIETRHGVLLTLYVNEQLAGLASGTPPEGGVGTIVWLLVHERFRRAGAGHILFNASCDAYRAMGAHKMKLTAPTDDARRFYEKCGMRQEGFHPDHWFHVDFYSMGIPL